MSLFRSAEFGATDDDRLTVPEPGGARDTPYVEPADITAKWQRFAARMDHLGGGPVDLEAKVVELRHPYALKRRDGTGVMRVTNPEGMLLILELTVRGYEGLRFFRDGTYSLDARAVLNAAYSAAMKRRLQPREQARPQDMVGRSLLITVERGPAKSVPDRGGYFWNIIGYKPIGVDFMAEEPPPPPPSHPVPPAEDLEYDDSDVPF